ncbi:hypothetical protein GCM10022392_30000 [Mucilaginibacter panaciglaebae]|uniref:Natural product n=1 Tax=Mucilaginibacter panaciglaebae TaxID=502331 RepID=A0ABP7X314_9SPHI
MKKLQLKLGGIKEMLTREEMKKVFGGSGSADPGCKSSCSNDSDCSGGFKCENDGSEVCPSRCSCH